MASSMMRNMIASVLVCLLFANYAVAHTYFNSLVINGQALNEGDCMRPHPPQNKEYPILSVTDGDMTCGWLPYAANPANRKCPVPAGTAVGLQWWHTAPGDDVLASTHVGPIIVYMAKSENGAGNTWFKIYQDGFDPITGLWATDKLIANRGLVTVTIPADIAPGNYLLRGEILALHNAYSVGGIQPYVGCAELTISGSGSSNPTGLVAFPGAYTPSGTGMLFDVYQPYNSYTIPGPAVYVSSGSVTSAPVTPTSAPTAAPTSAPTTAPSKAPTTAPTPYPTYAPPPASPTTRPTGNNILCSMNQGSNVWWIGVKLSGYSGTLVKVEVMDGHGLTSWAPLTDMGYAYVFSESIQLTLPLSLRFTNSQGAQTTANNVITSFTATNVNTGVNF